MTSFKLAMLVARVHFDGFTASRRIYLTALWWRLTGKKLRARAWLSPLLGQSSSAYALWMTRYANAQRQSRIKQARGSDPESRTLFVIVDASQNFLLLPSTLSSLEAPDKAAILDVHMRVPNSFSSLSEIAPMVDWDSDWLLLLRAGDRIGPGAEKLYAQASTESQTSIFYADDDELDAAGKRTSPHFKPRWNPELFRHHDYLSASCLLKVSRQDFEASATSENWIAELTRIAAESSPPHHLPFLLHHRITRPRPVIAPPLLSTNALPPISIIIPTRNGTELLRTCLQGLSRTDYPDMEVIIVDNDSSEESTLALFAELDPDIYSVLKHSGPFNYSAINNAAVRRARHPVLCFLNNDIEMLDADWLKALVPHALRNDIGAVGPMLLYPDGAVQHAGVVLGVGGGAAHAHRSLDPEAEGYFRRHALPQIVSAVTGACLVVKRDRFDEAGGFDECHFPVAFNDVDLCLKLTRLGYASFYEPRARLMHHESKSRGNDRDPVGASRLAKELQSLKKIWRTDQFPDPYHHRSLSPHSEQFVIDL